MPNPREDAAKNIEHLKAGSENEPIAKLLGLKLEELSPGYSKVTMKVRAEFMNFHGLLFGGIVMSIADQAFGYCSNSLNYPSVASQFNVHILAAADVGDTLIAEGRVLKNGRRAGTSEITITNQDGKLIAKATGTTIPVEETNKRS